MAIDNNNHAPAPFDPAFAPADYLPLSRGMRLEQSALLEDDRILTAGIDPDTGEFVLARHLESGWLDYDFGLHGVQRIASDLVRSTTSLSLRLEANGSLVMQGNLSDRFTGRTGVYLLRVLPDAQANPRLGVDAFLIVSLLPVASAPMPTANADMDWTSLRWPVPHAR